MARSRLSKDEAMARINAQIPLDVKIAHASHVIVNNAGYEPLATQVDDLWQQLIMGSRV
jgi:dephospho-CoA kinase